VGTSSVAPARRNGPSRAEGVRGPGEGHRYYVDDIVPDGPRPARSPASPRGLVGRGRWRSDWTAWSRHRVRLAARRTAPQSGRTLGRPRGDRRVSGYDLTFGAPKSVSILAMLAPGEIAAAVGRDTGLRSRRPPATSALCGGVRRSHRGVVAYLPSTGMVAGSFVHRTSRALDPHLHTHLVMPMWPRGRRPVVRRRQPSGLRPRTSHPGRLPRQAPTGAHRPTRSGVGGAPVRPR